MVDICCLDPKNLNSLSSSNDWGGGIGVQTAALGDSFVVREPSVSYSADFDSKMGLLSHQNIRSWKLSL